MTASDRVTSDSAESGSAAGDGTAGELSTSGRLDPVLSRRRGAEREGVGAGCSNEANAVRKAAPDGRRRTPDAAIGSGAPGGREKVDTASGPDGVVRTRSPGPLPRTTAFLGRLQRIHAAHVAGDTARARELLDALKADLGSSTEGIESGPGTGEVDRDAGTGTPESRSA